LTQWHKGRRKLKPRLNEEDFAVVIIGICGLLPGWAKCFHCNKNKMDNFGRNFFRIKKANLLINENVMIIAERGLNDMLFRVIQLIPKELVIYVNANDSNGAALEAAKIFGVPAESIHNPDAYSVKPVGGEDLAFV